MRNSRSAHTGLGAGPFGSRIRWKIGGPFLLLSVVSAFVGTFVVTQIVTGSLEERFTNQLVEAARVMEDSVVRQERVHLQVVRAVSFTEGVSNAAAAADSSSLADLIAPIAANTRAERIDVLDASGRELAGVAFDREKKTYVVSPRGPDYSGVEPVRAALSRTGDALGDKFAGMTAIGGETYLVTAGPITDQGTLVGVVLVATRLSTFLEAASTSVLAQVTVYAPDGTAIGSTFPADALTESATGARGAAPRAGLRTPATVSGREYEELWGRLQVRGVDMGWYSVALPTSFVTSANGATRLRMALLFSAMTVAVLLIGFVLAGRLTAPLLRLVQTARALGQGDLTARSHVRSRDEIGTLSVAFNQMAERLERQHVNTLAALVSAIDARDPYTRGHSVRVGQLSVELGRAMGLDKHYLHHLKVGGYLHDIGKIGVRDAVLLKPGRLTPEERAMIEMHPSIGLEILAPIGLPEDVLRIVGQHHERLDGPGYPSQLDADELTIFPRIASVSDIYDAISTDRPYRKGMSLEESLALLQREADAGLLDPEVVATMFRIAKQWEELRASDPMLANTIWPDPAKERTASGEPAANAAAGIILLRNGERWRGQRSA